MLKNFTLSDWQGKKSYLVILTVILLLCLGVIAYLAEFDLEAVISEGLDAVIGILGLLVVFELRNRTLIIGWTLYLVSFMIDLVDEIMDLPDWLNDYVNSVAYGAGLFMIVLAFYRLVKEKQRTADHFQGVSVRDELTGLFNHRYFYEYFQEAAEKSEGLTLLFCDLDYFKNINDNHGHIVGDSVLQETAHIIKESVRGRGTAFRYGGEEFAVILTDCHTEKACRIAEEIKINVYNSSVLQQHATHFPITVSIGMASYPENAVNGQELVKKADMAMYWAKQKGRNQISVYTPEIEGIFEYGYVRSIKQKMLLNSVFSLASALDAKDKYTSRHSEYVTKYALQIADAVQMSQEDKFRLRIGAMLHDCGKIGVPDEIINKPGCLTDDNCSAIHSHTLLGYNIIKHITDDADIIACVLNHHERWDGLGYPNNLSDNEIPFFARIIAIADAYHAMTSDRTYRKALPEDEAIRELKRCSGKHFDPLLVDKFIEILNRANSGSGPAETRFVAS